MQIIWETSDIRGGVVVGNWLRRPLATDRDERWMIVHRPAPENVFNIVSLNDGTLSLEEWLPAESMAAVLHGARKVPVEFLETKFARGGESGR